MIQAAFCCIAENEGVMAKNSEHEQESELRYGAALIVAVVGLMIPAILVFFLATRPDWKPNDVATLVGLFTGVVGTLVGAFLGVQVGAAVRNVRRTWQTERSLPCHLKEQLKF
jgi:hypothetical protein